VALVISTAPANSADESMSSIFQRLMVLGITDVFPVLMLVTGKDGLHNEKLRQGGQSYDSQIRGVRSAPALHRDPDE